MDIVLVTIWVVGLLLVLCGKAYAVGYRDAKERYDTGIVRYDLTK